MANGNFAGGSGAKNSPYLIEDVFDLDAMRNDLTAHYKLVNDINLHNSPFSQGTGWIPIGLYSAPNSKFRGTLDGDYHEIVGVYINDTSKESMSFIGFAGDCTIKNILLKDIYVRSRRYSSGLLRSYVGTSIIENVGIEGEVISLDGSGTGGVHSLSDNRSSNVRLTNCYFKGKITDQHTSRGRVGGLIGTSGGDNIIKNCYVLGECRGADYTAGLIGFTDKSDRVENSFVAAKISSSSIRSEVFCGRDAPDILSSFFNKDISENQSNNTDAIALSEDSMSNPLTFINAGWSSVKNPDDTPVWVFKEGEYPRLWFEVKPSNKTFIFHDGEYKNVEGNDWNAVSSVLPTQEQFENLGMENLGNIVPHLEELEGDIEAVTWTDSSEAGRVFNMKATPSPQFISQASPIKKQGGVENFTVQEDAQKAKFLLSPNKNTWRTWEINEFASADKEEAYVRGISSNQLKGIDLSDWSKWEEDNIYVGIYLRDNMDDTEETEIFSISYDEFLSKESTQISDARLYILNTVSTIDVLFSGNTVTGAVDDEDEGKVQYRIILNGENYFPNDGSFTPLMPSPLDISMTLDNSSIKIDENNTLRIEFKDYWGSVDYWQTDFVGTYSGLLFMDETGEYFSTDIGEILQYLDFGIIIAGQTTIEQTVRLKNTYGYTVENINIRANQSQFPEGMKAQFGKSALGFESLEELDFPDELEDGEEITFYIRLTSVLGTTGEANGSFDIIVKADKVESNS